MNHLTSFRISRSHCERFFEHNAGLNGEVETGAAFNIAPDVVDVLIGDSGNVGTGLRNIARGANGVAATGWKGEVLDTWPISSAIVAPIIAIGAADGKDNMLERNRHVAKVLNGEGGRSRHPGDDRRRLEGDVGDEAWRGGDFDGRGGELQWLGNAQSAGQVVKLVFDLGHRYGNNGDRARQRRLIFLQQETAGDVAVAVGLRALFLNENAGAVHRHQHLFKGDEAGGAIVDDHGVLRGAELIHTERSQADGIDQRPIAGAQ